MCGPVAAELLAGAPAAARTRLRSLLAGLPRADLGRRQWLEAGETSMDSNSAGLASPFVGQLRGWARR